MASLVLATNSLTSMPAGFGLFLGAMLFTIGGAAFGFLIPALSGYIAYALAGRPGIAPGFVGGAISVTLGAGFIAAAARIVKPQGRFFMVANRQLPYEAALDAAFARWEKIAEDGAFKMFRADRPRRA